MDKMVPPEHAVQSSVSKHGMNTKAGGSRGSWVMDEPRPATFPLVYTRNHSSIIEFIHRKRNLHGSA